MRNRERIIAYFLKSQSAVYTEVRSSSKKQNVSLSHRLVHLAALGLQKEREAMHERL